MFSINISSLKNELSAVLRRVRKGEDALVLDRDRPVAKISSVRAADHIRNDKDLINELEKRGIIKKATKKLPKDWFKKHPPLRIKGSAVRALLKEREEAPY